MEILVMLLKGTLLVAAVLMTFFILLQEGKGGGLAALGGTKGAAVEGVTNPIRRATAYLAVIFFLCAICLGFLTKEPKSLTGSQSIADEKAVEAAPANGAPKETEAKAPAVPASKTDAPAPEAGKTGEPRPVEVTIPIPPAKSEAPAGKTEAAKTEEAKSEVPAAKTGETKTEAPASKTESAPAKTEDAKTEAKTPAPEK